VVKGNKIKNFIYHLNPYIRNDDQERMTMKAPAEKKSKSERERLERQAQALRDNLQRRKTQMRGRKTSAAPTLPQKGDPDHG
jgi:hypothetical protein